MATPIRSARGVLTTGVGRGSVDDEGDGNLEVVEARFDQVQTSEQYEKTKDKPRLSVYQADRFRWELSHQPNWRREMSTDEDFYDGNQFTSEELQQYEDRGIPAVSINLVGPTIDLLLGMEAKSRTDWVVKPEADGGDELAQAASQLLSQAEKRSFADDACSSALARQVKGGLGVVEVGYESDPFRYPYRVRSHDWRQFGFDPLGEEEGLQDARFLRRAKFFDRVELEAKFKDKARQIHEIGPGHGRGYGTGYITSDDMLDNGPQMRASDGLWRDYSMREMEWIDTDRDRLLLDEVWYRVHVRGQVLRLPDMSAIKFQPNNDVHQAAVESGQVQLIDTSWPEVRMAMFVGPLRLQDIPSPYPHREFPYVLFWGAREGKTRLPYGVIRRMRPLQREINARRSKMMWALSARRVIATDDAVADHDAVAEEISRPDAYVRLGQNYREGKSVFKVDDNQGIANDQYKVLVDSVQRIQDVAGIYNTQLGKKDGGADSGIAINQLIEQGSTTVAPIFASYRAGRTRVGQQLLSLVLKDLVGKKNVPVKVKGPRGKKTVYLNRPKTSELTGNEVLENNVESAELKVTLSDTASTATYRAQQAMVIGEFIKIMQQVNPEIAAKYLDLLADASDLPNKEDFVARLRHDMGIPKDPSEMSPEEQQEAAAQQQDMAKQKALQQANAEAEVGLVQGKAALASAQAQKAQVDAQAAMQNLPAQMEKVMAEVQAIGAKIALMSAQVAKTKEEARAIEIDATREKASPLPAATEGKSVW